MISTSLPAALNMHDDEQLQQHMDKFHGNSAAHALAGRPALTATAATPTGSRHGRSSQTWDTLQADCSMRPCPAVQQCLLGWGNADAMACTARTLAMRCPCMMLAHAPAGVAGRQDSPQVSMSRSKHSISSVEARRESAAPEWLYLAGGLPTCKTMMYCWCSKSQIIPSM